MVEQESATTAAAADTAFWNQEIVMNVKRRGVFGMFQKSATGFPDVDFQNP